MFDAILFTLGTTNGKFVCSRTPWSTDHIFYRIFNHSDYSDFSQIFLTAERTNLNKLQSITENETSKVRMEIKEVKGIYRKRVAGTKQAFLKKEEYEVSL